MKGWGCPPPLLPLLLGAGPLGRAQSSVPPWGGVPHLCQEVGCPMGYGVEVQSDPPCRTLCPVPAIAVLGCSPGTSLMGTPRGLRPGTFLGGCVGWHGRGGALGRKRGGLGGSLEVSAGMGAPTVPPRGGVVPDGWGKAPRPGALEGGSGSLRVLAVGECRGGCGSLGLCLGVPRWSAGRGGSGGMASARTLPPPQHPPSRSRRETAPGPGPRGSFLRRGKRGRRWGGHRGWRGMRRGGHRGGGGSEKRGHRRRGRGEEGGRRARGVPLPPLPPQLRGPCHPSLGGGPERHRPPGFPRPPAGCMRAPPLPTSLPGAGPACP